VLAYLGFSLMDRYVVPQIVVIDRKGMIRAQTPREGNASLTSEPSLRILINTLLQEGAPTSNTKKTPAAAKKAS
jgi:hypothetical protein